MTTFDVKRLKQDAVNGHLERYECANDQDAARVLDVACGYCHAKEGEQCHDLSA